MPQDEKKPVEKAKDDDYGWGPPRAHSSPGAGGWGSQWSRPLADDRQLDPSGKKQVLSTKKPRGGILDLPRLIMQAIEEGVGGGKRRDPVIQPLSGPEQHLATEGPDFRGLPQRPPDGLDPKELPPQGSWSWPDGPPAPDITGTQLDAVGGRPKGVPAEHKDVAPNVASLWAGKDKAPPLSGNGLAEFQGDAQAATTAGAGAQRQPGVMEFLTVLLSSMNPQNSPGDAFKLSQMMMGKGERDVAGAREHDLMKEYIRAATKGQGQEVDPWLRVKRQMDVLPEFQDDEEDLGMYRKKWGDSLDPAEQKRILEEEIQPRQKRRHERYYSAPPRSDPKTNQ